MMRDLKQMPRSQSWIFLCSGCLSSQNVIIFLLLVALLRCGWSPVELMRPPSRGILPSQGLSIGASPVQVSRDDLAKEKIQSTQSSTIALQPLPPPPPPLSEQRFLLSSILYYGRISNIKISLLELMASSAAAGRTLVIPELSECAVDGYDRSFGGLFDDSTPLAAGALSLGSFDFVGACNGSAVFIDPGHFPGGPHGTANLGDLRIPGEGTMPVLNVVDIPPTAGDVVFGKAKGHPLLGEKGFLSTSEMQSGPIHTRFYAPGQRRTFEGYRKDPLFIEKIAARPEKCVVLGKNFQMVNWERAPELFVKAVRSLVPAHPIRSSALSFLASHGLASPCPAGEPAAAAAYPDLALAAVSPLKEKTDAGNSGPLWGGSSSPTPPRGSHFFGVHLRMGDFLTDSTHRSFGAECNSNPNRIVEIVSEMLAGAAHVAGPIVVASDDYSTPCFEGLVKKWGDRVIKVEGGSGYRGSTCSAALFDQEVLGHSAIFLGDKESSFSEAIHRVRTLRCGSSVDSTRWV